MKQIDLTVSRKIDLICNEFEGDLCDGKQPRLRDALSQVETPERSLLFRELLAIEVEWRLSNNGPSIDDYLVDFPDQRETVEEVFEKVVQEATNDTENDSSTISTSEIDFMQEIGRGGMGVILRGHDKDLSRDIAYKVLHAELASSKEAHQRFEQEAKICGRLEHPGIVPVHSFGKLPDGRPFFSMKLVEGRTLKEILKHDRESVSDQRLLDIFVQTCRAVGYAHACNVIHRDLKPENVMVGAFGEVQVMDWGLSKDVSTEEEAIERSDVLLPHGFTRMGSVLGTPSYMSPEQSIGAVDAVDARTDVFSLGVMLCEILTGVTPADFLRNKSEFPNEETIAKSLRFVEAHNCDNELLSILTSCLSWAPEKRPQNATELANAVEQFREGTQKRLREAELEFAKEKARVNEYAKRRRILYASLVCLACMIVALFSIVNNRNQDRRDRLARAIHALKDAESLFERASQTRTFDSPLWRQARRDAERASSLVDQTVDGPILERTNSLIRQLDLILTLGTIRQSESETNVELNRFSIPAAIPKYEQAFIDFGLRPYDEPASQAAARLKGFPKGAKFLFFIALSRCSEVQSAAEEAKWWLQVEACLDDDPWRKRVRQAIELNDHKELVQCVFSFNISQQPPILLLRISRRLFSDGHPDLAEQILRRAQLAHPNDFWLNHDLATMLTEQTPPQLNDAIRYYTAAVVLQKRAGTFLNLGATLIRAKRFEEAEAALKEAVTIQPDYSHAYCFLAQAQIELQKFDEAKKNIDIAAELKKDIHHWHFTAGMLHFHQGEYKEAMSFLREASRLHQPLVNRIVKYSDILFQRKKLSEAIAYLELANDIKPSHPHTLFHYALMHQRIGNIAEAERLYKEMIKIAPGHAEAFCNLGHIYRRRSQYELALECFKKGHQIGRTLEKWRYPSDVWIAETEKLISEQNQPTE